MPTAQEIYDQQLLQDDPFDYNKAMDEYKGGRKPLLDAIMSNYKKPEKQINPEQEKKAKYGAALSDTFGSLAQMFAHGQGARVQRNQGASSTEKTNARLQAIRDKYEQDLTQYQTIKGNAAVQDLNMHLANAKEASGKKRQYLLYRAEAAQEAEKERIRLAERAEDRETRAKQHADDIALGYARLNKDEKDKTPKTLPVFVNNKQHEFPADLMEEVVARAIKDKVAGNTTVETTDRRGQKTKTSVPIQPNTPLSVQQKQQIFQSVYPRYLQEGDNGKLLIRRGLSDYDKKSGITAQEKWKMPKTPATSPKQPAATPAPAQKPATSNTKQTTIDPSKYGGYKVK